MNMPRLYYTNNSLSGIYTNQSPGAIYYIGIADYPYVGDSYILLATKLLPDIKWALSNIGEAIDESFAFGTRFTYTRWLSQLSAGEILSMVQAVSPAITITTEPGAYCTKCNMFNEYLAGPYLCSGCKIWDQP
jgi:hypothetical protein